MIGARNTVLLALTVLALVAPATAHADKRSRAAFTAQASWYWGVDTSPIPVIFDYGEYRCPPEELGWSNVPDTEIHLCLGEWHKSTLAERCHTWLHEIGHALGHDHTRRGLMAPHLKRPIAVCRARAREVPLP